MKSEIVARSKGSPMEVALAKLQWGKNDVGYSLHVNPNTFSTSGLQTSDFLAYLGFQRSDRCPFTHRCFVKWVDEGFDIEFFKASFIRAYAHLAKAESGLQACGFALAQPEGWGFFYGKAGGRSARGPARLSGDGHLAQKVQGMKQSEDETFRYKFTFIESDREKGFVTHYRPKHLPISSELTSVLRYLGIREFGECPEFDFEPCFFSTLAFESRPNSFFDSNAEFAHGCFDAHAGTFSPAIRDLLEANAEIEATGLTFLPFAKPADRFRADIGPQIILPKKPAANTVALVVKSVGAAAGMPERFDVAISFAGTEREHAHKLAQMIRDAGYAVFYDEFYPEQLWGKNLASFFDEIFRKRSRFCVMFISKEYQDRKWTSHEARSAQARALEEKGNEYILPIRVDDTELEGLPPTIGYVPIRTGIEKIGEILVNKLKA